MQLDSLLRNIWKGALKRQLEPSAARDWLPLVLQLQPAQSRALDT
jgi:hypothetical protein